MWRSTPWKVWGEIIGELCDGFRFLPHYQSVEQGGIDADYHGFAATEGEIPVEAYSMYHYWPEVRSDDQYGTISQE